MDSQIWKCGIEDVPLKKFLQKVAYPSGLNRLRSEVL